MGSTVSIDSRGSVGIGFGDLIQNPMNLLNLLNPMNPKKSVIDSASPLYSNFYRRPSRGSGLASYVASIPGGMGDTYRVPDRGIAQHRRHSNRGERFVSAAAFTRN